MGEISVQVRTDVDADARSDQRPHRRWLTLAHVVWIICAVFALLVFLAAIPLGYTLRLNGASIGPPVDAPAWYIALMSFAQGVVSFLAALVSLTLAGVVFWKKRDDPGALFVSFYLLAHGIVIAGPLEALNGFPPLFPGAPMQSGLLISTDMILGLQAALLSLTLLLFYLFPNGRFVPRRTRYAALSLLVITPIFIHVSAVEWLPTTTPFAWVTFATCAVLMGVGIYAQIYRYRRIASRIERQQTKWAVFGLLLTVFIIVVSQIPYMIASQIPPGMAQPWWVPLFGLGWWMAMSIMPFSLAIAVLRYRLWDIDIIINRTLVYGSLTALIVGLYILIVAVVGALFQTTGNLAVSLLATGLIAILFQPLRERLQRGVNRLMYGERDDPYAVLSKLGQRLESTFAPEAVLPTIVETIAQTLKLPYVAIALKRGGDFEIAAAFGPSVTHVLHLPLVYQNESNGELIVALRAAGEAFTSSERRLLDDIAHQAGIAAHMVRLTADLQQSRERLILAREEERRRLRRDLHDGLGPLLASQTLTLDAVAKLIGRDPSAAAALVRDLKAQAQTAILDIRRVVYDLRPPALDNLGLVGALRESALNYQSTGIHITVNAPADLSPLPAAVEVAAYRIAFEAMTNVVRHARAHTCEVCLSLIRSDGHAELRLEVQDDGRGLPIERRAGVGIHSMRERAEELGGSCTIHSQPGGGTYLVAHLPLPKGDELR